MQGTQDHSFIIARQPLQVLIVQIACEQVLLQNAAHLPWMPSHLSHQRGGIAAQHIRPQENEAAEIQPLDHAWSRQQIHRGLQFRQFEACPEQRQFHSLLEFGEANKD